ncbi:MAG TPA: cupin domain-containing protein [Hyphomonadaceae bacterium]|jgi:mannose-6-phosphate isomerase-like protein (cupin superfamily)
MKRLAVFAAIAAFSACASAQTPSSQAVGPMVVVDERTVVRDEPPPHGAIGMSTAYRISDVAPKRSMEFRKRTLHVGAAIGLHPIDHDEVYYVLEGEGEVTSDGKSLRIGPGTAAYLYSGAVVGIKQLGDKPLTIIISYPLKERTK